MSNKAYVKAPGKNANVNANEYTENLRGYDEYASTSGASRDR